jgi:hypothetical protein
MDAKFYSDILKRRDHFGDLNADRRIINTLCLMDLAEIVLDSSWYRIGASDGFS